MMPPSAGPSGKAPIPGVASKETNEYIPTFITKKPFYVDNEQDNADYLEHQRIQKAEQSDLSKWYDRGKKLGPAATKYRKGACENCGAMTHKSKDCLSRPRAKGARWTGKDIQADEAIQKVELSWDAKRDRWNGYDTKEYKHIVDEYNMLEEMKRAAKGPTDEDDEDGAKYAEESDMGRHQDTATRQLRLREDTAKYLLNLDLDSAKYDPKTRTMIDMGATLDKSAAMVAEEGFMRSSGDAGEFEKAQKYAWETQERSDGPKLHLQANPTSGEYYRKIEEEKQKQKRDAHQKLLAEKYGGEQHQMPEALRAVVTETERFVEYDDYGAIKGAPKTTAKSKYAEDVLINNHQSVWGSWWSNFQWGYACCHSTVKNSYCTGEAGKKGFEDAERMRTGGALERDQPKEIEWKAAEPPAETTVKKRSKDEMLDGVTEEEMEEYRRKRLAADDPMAKFIGKDVLE